MKKKKFDEYEKQTLFRFRKQSKYLLLSKGKASKMNNIKPVLCFLSIIITFWTVSVGCV